jgi:hypothetical protein
MRKLYVLSAEKNRIIFPRILKTDLNFLRIAFKAFQKLRKPLLKGFELISVHHQIRRNGYKKNEWKDDDKEIKFFALK